MQCPNKQCTQYQAYRIGNCAYFTGTCRYAGRLVVKTRSEPKREQHIAKKYCKYGLSPAQQQKLLSQQNNRCAICRDEMEEPQLDHNHETNKARGYLCRSYNVRIAGIEDAVFSKQALKYLKNPPVKKL